MYSTDTTPGTEYTSIDLNATGTTTLFDADTGAVVSGVYLANGGGTAVVSLEITDGTDTATLVDNAGSGGAGISFTGPLEVPASDDLQVNVSTAEGTAQTNTAVVVRSVE